MDFETLVTKGASIFSACSGGRDEQYFLSKVCCYKHRFESTRAHVLNPWPLWTVRHPATRETCVVSSALGATGAATLHHIMHAVWPRNWRQSGNALLPFGVVLNALLLVSTKPGTQTPAFFAGWFQEILDLRIKSDCGTPGSRMTFTPTWQTCGKSLPERHKASPSKASQELSTRQRIMIAGILAYFRCSEGVGMFDLAARQFCFCWFSVPGCETVGV